MDEGEVMKATNHSRSFEDAIIDGIVAQFFQPRQTSIDPNGFIQYAAPPAVNVIIALWDKRKEEIIKAISANLDVDAVAEQIAARVIVELTATPRWGNTLPGVREKIEKAFIDKVAEQQADEFRAKMLLDQAAAEVK